MGASIVKRMTMRASFHEMLEAYNPTPPIHLYEVHTGRALTQRRPQKNTPSQSICKLARDRHIYTRLDSLSRCGSSRSSHPTDLSQKITAELGPAARVSLSSSLSSARPFSARPSVTRSPRRGPPRRGPPSLALLGAALRHSLSCRHSLPVVAGGIDMSMSLPDSRASSSLSLVLTVPFQFSMAWSVWDALNTAVKTVSMIRHRSRASTR